MNKSKNRMFTIRFSEEEHRILMSRAVRRGESLTEYVRWILLRGHGREKQDVTESP